MKIQEQKNHRLSIKCTTENTEEKEHIIEVFRNSPLCMSGFVLHALREKVLEIERDARKRDRGVKG